MADRPHAEPDNTTHNAGSQAKSEIVHSELFQPLGKAPPRKYEPPEPRQVRSTRRHFIGHIPHHRYTGIHRTRNNNPEKRCTE